VFAEQIALANARGFALVIHSRDAWDDTFAVLADVGIPARAVFHCFTGGPDEARRALDIGALLSFSGIVTFKGAPEVQAAATLCPLDRMLVETDSPYLAPVPHRGQTNRPAWVAHVGQHIADLRGIAIADVAAETTANARAVFALTAR
jgi:TatD DNase family protein